MKTNTKENVNENIIYEKSLREEIGKHRDKAFDIINKVGGLMLLDNESLAPLNEVQDSIMQLETQLKCLLEITKRNFKNRG